MNFFVSRVCSIVRPLFVQTALLYMLAHISLPLHAQVIPPGTTGETALRVLFVSEPDVTVVEQSAAINSVINSWNTTGLLSSTNLAIEIANNGQVYEPVLFFPTDANQLISVVQEHVSEVPVGSGQRPIRDRHNADVIVVIAEDLTFSGVLTCGLAKGEHWLKNRPEGTTNFSDSADGLMDGLDRQGSETGFVAAVSVDTACPNGSGAHEFGHLLGGDHIEIIPGGGQDRSVIDNGHAYRRITASYGYPITFKVEPTALASPFQDNPCVIPNIQVSACIYKNRFSDPSVGWGFTRNDNRSALETTAASVAAYRSGGAVTADAQCSDGIDNDGDGQIDNGVDSNCTSVNDDNEAPSPPSPPPTCNSAVAPHSYTGVLSKICVGPSSATRYILEWEHACPNKVSYYEIMYKQPETGPLQSGWTRTVRWSNAEVAGAPARSWVRACGAAGCSGLSNTSFLAIDQC